MTLYHFTLDKGRKLACKGSCLKFWPPLLLKRGAKPTAGTGVAKAKVGTIRRPDGRLQVTYAGFPLYRYVGDVKRGDAKGQGVQKAWFVVTPAGRILKKPLS
jgi:predicted lipoprotein with Yx(FWY)xxD motif